MDRSLGKFVTLGFLLFAGCQPLQTAPVANQQPVVVPAQQAPMFVAPSGATTIFEPPQPGQVGPPVAGNAVMVQPSAAPQAVAVQNNPIFVPVSNQDWAWEQIVDVVDDYFRIERESRVQVVGNIVTEGRIDTFPQIGANVLERHRPDSVGRYNRWESTFQSIRRRGLVRVIPDRNGYLIDLAVYKELEDLPAPENATTGASTFRNDGSLRSSVTEPVSRTRLSPFWIPLGRDQACEQQMLAEIQQRLGSSANKGVVMR